MTIEGDLKKLRATMSKADKARNLITLGYSSSEISKAVPMAYSQVHSIAAKMGGSKPKAKADHGSLEVVYAPRGLRVRRAEPSTWDQSAKAPGKRTMKPLKSKVLDDIKKRRPVDVGRISGRVGKLRTPGLPSDTDVGECINCGFGLVVRLTPPGYCFVHVGVSAEEHLTITQFCQAVPKALLA